MIKIWNHHISNILDANNLYGWAMSQKLRLNGFKWVEELSQFKEVLKNILDANNLYGWAMSQKLRLNGFKWVEELSQFKEDFIKKYDEDSNKGYFLRQMLNIQKICFVFIVIYFFYLKGTKCKNVISLFVRFMTRKTMLFT